MAAQAHICELGPLSSEPLAAGVRVRCDGQMPRGRRSGRCAKQATHGVLYPWGAACFCPRHYEEECGASSSR